MRSGNDNWFLEKADGHAVGLEIISTVHVENSPFQKIEIFKTKEYGYLMTLDDKVMLTSRDNFIYHEMIAHPALLFHCLPKKVAVVGGGDCGTLREVLRHPEVESAVQVELDERVTRVSEQFFPELCAANHDPRAQFVFADAIAWMSQQDEGTADVIILDTTDPVGQAERLFGESFYRDCCRVLKGNGILAVQSESPFANLKLIRTVRDTMRQAGFLALTTLAFPQPTYPTGWWSVTLTSKEDRFGEIRHVAAKQLPTRYYHPGIHSAAAVLPEFVRQAMNS